MHPRLSELLTYAEAQRDALLTAALAVPAERWNERLAPDQWSLAELCQHLHLVERGSARLIAKRAAEARQANHPSETGTSSMIGTLDGRGITDRSRRLDAPDRVKPRDAWTRDQALQALASSRAELRAAVATADGLALGTVTAAHPRLGEIDLYQWILFIGQHEARHVPQAAEIVQQLVPAGR